MTQCVLSNILRRTISAFPFEVFCGIWNASRHFFVFFFLQMVKLCWAHGLYDAIFYVYNRGMRDYTTPLEVLLWPHTFE